MDNILVSISCLAYNHAPYMRQCLDGFLMQKTDFPFEIVIHDDASTDGTVDIIREYENKYPNIIKPIYQTENQYSKGIKPTWKFNAPRWKGKYIALCEGDDYWTDPLKLQKQVDFLEENEEYSMIHTDVKGLYKGELVWPAPYKSWNYKKNILNLNDAILHPIAHTCTVVFRNSLSIGKNKYITNKIKAGDWALWVYLNLNGKTMFLKEITTVYRINVGVSHKSNFSDEFRNRSIYLYNLATKNKSIGLKSRITLFYGSLFYYFDYYSKVTNHSGLSLILLKTSSFFKRKLKN